MGRQYNSSPTMGRAHISHWDSVKLQSCIGASYSKCRISIFPPQEQQLDASDSASQQEQQKER